MLGRSGVMTAQPSRASDQPMSKSLTMKDRSTADFSELGDPIELVARFVVQQDWYLKQTHADGLVVDVPGQWGRVSAAC